MIKKHSKVTVIIVAILMFTSTWAGVFAADTDAPQNTEEDTPAAAEGSSDGIVTEGQDVVVDEETNSEEEVVTTEEPVEEEEAVEAEVPAEDVVVAQAKAVSFAAPEVQKNGTVAGATITVSWDAPTLTDTQEITGYTVTEYKKSGTPKKRTVSVAGTKTTATFQKTPAGIYTYKVTANIEETQDDATVKTTSESKESVAITLKPTAPANVKALSGCKSIVLKFDKGSADGFLIYRYTTEANFKNCRADRRISPDNGKGYCTYAGNAVTWTNSKNVALTHNYWYRVCTVIKKDPKKGFSDDNVIRSDYKLIVNKGCVRPMYITLKLKKKRTLKSLNGGPRITLKKNTVITANGFGGGCYYFTYKGKKYRMARTSAKKQKAYYNGRNGYNYTPEEAELFVNQAGLTSKTKYLIWVSFYTQHVYVMQKTSAGWKCIPGRNWECATGKASTPSPTGHKAIGKKKTSHHGIKWWSSFSNPKSIANSLHGKKKGWKLGLPQSHGCIRNDVANAKFIYKNCPKKTMVYNY